MTSNIGSSLIQKISESNGDRQEMIESVNRLLKVKMAPEFLNRIDEKIIFSPLSIEQVREIVDIQIDLISERIAQRFLKLVIEQPARDWIAKQSYDPVYGARPIKRFIQQNIENLLAREILRREIVPESTLRISWDGESFRLDIEECQKV
jgi:ATP-dependent Clp protease ATP-binding subunit ClpB